MLLIKDYSNEVNHRILAHGDDVFHKALDAVLKGEREFHVLGENGIRYNLEYTENQNWAESSPDYPDSPLFHKDPLYPPYYFYDEYDRDRLCFDILEGFDSVWFEEANEYTAVLIGVLLRYTGLAVYCHDPRILWFHEESERLKITEEIPPA
ncbi:MAG: hypothetical protein II156_03360 [Lachnospiraceae bacterium]|nr:hypothetical protein [Lachnospiraceae bacterium]